MTTMRNKHQTANTREQRATRNQHRSFILWFTGLSGAGKSSLAEYLEGCLFERDCNTFILDGDNVRQGLCTDLQFSDEDRSENIRRIGEVSLLFIDAGVITLAAFISPFRADRDQVRSLVPEDDFIEIYCQASLEICEQRDVKGLYKKARRGEIIDFTGISSPYEAPINPEIRLDTGHHSLEQCADEIMAYLLQHGYLS
ncbi:MAG: adenylyl-sulfate kinase [Methylophaga sp.]|nr:MAG: adenylyl-sulfate kinase [Methylophaga sp.]